MGACDVDPTTDASTMTPSDAPQPTAPRTYVVRKGDTLSGIAEAELGDRERWRELFEINRAMLDDPDRIEPGQVLQLPAA